MPLPSEKKSDTSTEEAEKLSRQTNSKNSLDTLQPDALPVPEDLPPSTETPDSVPSSLKIAQPVEVGQTGGRPACYRNVAHEVAFTIVCMLSVGAVSMTVGSVVIISEKIALDLNMSSGNLSWLISGPSLVSGAFLLMASRIADVYGGKRLLVGSFFIFSVTCLGMGFCREQYSLIVLSCLSGLFMATIVPPAQSMLSRAYGHEPSPRKNMAFALYQSGFPVGFTAGMFTGSVAVEVTNWRGVFYFEAMLFGVTTLFAWFASPNLPVEEITDDKLQQIEIKPWAQKLPAPLQKLVRWWAYMDFTGALLTITGFTLFSAPLTMSEDAPNGWATGYIIGMLVTGLVLIGVFVYWEIYHATNPIVDFHLIRRNRNLSAAMYIIFTTIGALASTELFMSLYMQRIWGESPLIVGCRFLPLVMMGIVGSVASGFLIHRLDNKLLSIGGFGVFNIGILFLCLHRDTYDYWGLIFACFMILTLGFNIAYNTCNMFIISTIPPDAQAIASGITQTVSRLGVAVGLAIFTSIYNQGEKDRQAGKFSPPNSDPYYHGGPYRPYAMGMWVMCVLVAVSLIVNIIFLKGGKLGAKEKKDEEKSAGEESI